MGRLLVVSPDPAFAQGLTATGHEIVEIGPTAFQVWMDVSGDDPMDGVVIDVPDAPTALRAITELRARARMVPVLVVPGDGDGWEDPRLRDLPAAALLPSPVTESALHEAARRLVEEGPDSFVSSQVRRRDDAAVDDGDMDSGGTAVAPPPAPEPPLRRSARVHAAVARRRRERTAAELVNELRAVAHELYAVSETAEVIVNDALSRVDGGAAVLLLPDGPHWRVVGGLGLRPVEERLELGPEDWLVQQVGRGHRALVVEDTDLVRQPLRGAPLAGWHHLVVAPVTEVDGVLLVARGVEAAPFTETHVEALIALAQEAGPLLRASMDARALARRLEPLREHPPTARRAD